MVLYKSEESQMLDWNNWKRFGYIIE